MDITRFHNTWFAIQVAPRRERTVAAILQNKGYQHLLPTYRPKGLPPTRAALPLFPGYVFCRLNLEIRAPIICTPGVVRIVGYGRQPVSLPEHEIEPLCQVVASGCHAEPRRYLSSGQLFRISDGPLRGTVGMVVNSGEESRLVLSVTLLQRSISVEVEPEWLTPIGSSGLDSAGTS
jgi:transcription antitermination factor NusG